MEVQLSPPHPMFCVNQIFSTLLSWMIMIVVKVGFSVENWMLKCKNVHRLLHRQQVWKGGGDSISGFLWSHTIWRLLLLWFMPIYNSCHLFFEKSLCILQVLSTGVGGERWSPHVLVLLFLDSVPSRVYELHAREPNLITSNLIINMRALPYCGIS